MSAASDRPSGQTPPTAPSPATPAPSLRDLAERTLATGESLRALRAARIGGTTKEFHTADMEARQTFNQAFDAFSEAATPAAIIALSDELESTRSALREAQRLGEPRTLPDGMTDCPTCGARTNLDAEALHGIHRVMQWMAQCPNDAEAQEVYGKAIEALRELAAAGSTT